ncbi:hypothetical protein [Nonomuraea sp. NEAU-A123]|uniref:hypothetical protein n=1 Tax=Nonomuraea sp. NEAU-A123 TaxID=2839649 RepID=UPI001BE3ED1C|nr:hypothetical protein [Nonomuraea sp. NEAU-A123]MBT2235787.1 hypothetical protein [Nonomuraea sp. NEAU-A123]
MPIAAAIAVVVFGAILTFAVADGSVGAFNLRIVGVVLILGGAALLLPLLLRSRSRWSKSTVRSRQDVIDDRPPPTLIDPPHYDGRQGGTRRAAPDDRRL